MKPAVYRKSRRRPFLRNIAAAEKIEAFLVSGVLAVLGIRLYLDLSGYPKLASETLHIAHMLWGGLLMLVALLILLGFLGRAAAWTGAILGGLGFGTFLDEVGKFVTRDNDYFYRPAVAIMYVVFVITYLGVRRILTARRYTAEEYLLNAIEELEELALGDLDAEEKERTLRYLEGADPANPLVAPLRALLHSAALVPVGAPPLAVRIKRRLGRLYEHITRLPHFATALVLFFVAQLLLKLYQGVIVALFFGMGWESAADLRFVGDLLERLRQLPVAGWGELFASLLASTLTLLGVIRVVQVRLAGYYWFQRSILVSILLTQVFMFYREQVSAVVGLLANISVLAALNYMIHAERALQERRGRE